jgi:hypothetical protein
MKQQPFSKRQRKASRFMMRNRRSWRGQPSQWTLPVAAPAATPIPTERNLVMSMAAMMGGRRPKRSAPRKTGE